MLPRRHTLASIRKRSAALAFQVRSHVRGFTALADWSSRRRLLQVKIAGRLGRRVPSVIELRPRELHGNSLWVRPGTTDLGTIVHDLSLGEHLPPLSGLQINVAVELGSNIGTGLAGLAARYPSATILGVEPDAANATLARRNVEVYGSRCTVVEAAIWDRATSLIIDGEAPSGYQVRPAVGSEGHEARVVDAVTIDSLLEAHLPRTVIDYLIFNLEGAEERVLAAGGEWPLRVRMLRAELHPAKGFTAERCVKQLSALGFAAWVQAEWWGGWGFAVRQELLSDPVIASASKYQANQKDS